ncbi:unnamed protein product [Protopolystoma xenopodis]|uniref:Uncharacterized protein n=1 Tax=Protopolystoma xenopodis TaxID=117903 RepID=A0A448WD49_9PLAT|nr:unnamed protein product [Protopolystoma xenopodis]
MVVIGADVNSKTEETQETALTLAACGGFIEVCKMLLDAGADIEVGGVGCSTPLMEAAQEGHLDLVAALIKRGANVNSITATGDTALHYAAENGHVKVCQLLLASGADINAMPEGGRTPLMKAARAGHLEVAQLFVERGVPINQATVQNDANVLSLACNGGHVKVVEYLIQNGADPQYLLRDGCTMLIEAARSGNSNVLRLLLDYPKCLIPPSPPPHPPPPPPPVSVSAGNILSTGTHTHHTAHCLASSGAGDLAVGQPLPIHSGHLAPHVHHSQMIPSTILSFPLATSASASSTGLPLNTVVGNGTASGLPGGSALLYATGKSESLPGLPTSSHEAAALGGHLPHLPAANRLSPASQSDVTPTAINSGGLTLDHLEPIGSNNPGAAGTSSLVAGAGAAGDNHLSLWLNHLFTYVYAVGRVAGYAAVHRSQQSAGPATQHFHAATSDACSIGNGDLVPGAASHLRLANDQKTSAAIPSHQCCQSLANSSLHTDPAHTSLPPPPPPPLPHQWTQQHQLLLQQALANGAMCPEDIRAGLLAIFQDFVVDNRKDKEEITRCLEAFMYPLNAPSIRSGIDTSSVSADLLGRPNEDEEETNDDDEVERVPETSERQQLLSIGGLADESSLQLCKPRIKRSSRVTESSTVSVVQNRHAYQMAGGDFALPIDDPGQSGQPCNSGLLSACPIVASLASTSAIGTVSTSLSSPIPGSFLHTLISEQAVSRGSGITTSPVVATASLNLPNSISSPATSSEGRSSAASLASSSSSTSSSSSSSSIPSSEVSLEANKRQKHYFVQQQQRKKKKLPSDKPFGVLSETKSPSLTIGQAIKTEFLDSMSPNGIANASSGLNVHMSCAGSSAALLTLPTGQQLHLAHMMANGTNMSSGSIYSDQLTGLTSEASSAPSTLGHDLASYRPLVRTLIILSLPISNISNTLKL